MKFTETAISGAWLIDPAPISDQRGHFARIFCRDEFRAHGLHDITDQMNLSFNHRAGTLRGMHYQVAPATEAKLVRCIRGSIYDVIVDLRPGSPTYLQHLGFELSDQNGTALYVPELFAHGYQSLSDGATVTYQVSAFYAPGMERGIRHDDPALAIDWPREVAVISEKDASWPLYDAARALM
jgi:dTDP-4-dehydrorhamnose 3,5-epimerase